MTHKLARTGQVRRSARVAAAALMLLLASGAAISAHDSWIVPNAFAVGVDGWIEVKGQTSVKFPTQGQGDSSTVAATVERFHAALAAGDSAGALALLTADVIILESGGVETRAEYRSHHLSGDIAFARAVKSERGPTRVVVRGDVAWASGTSVTQGDYRGRPINSAGAELAVLTRTPEGWRIAALHWSSRTRRAPGG